MVDIHLHHSEGEFVDQLSEGETISKHIVIRSLCEYDKTHGYIGWNGSLSRKYIKRLDEMGYNVNAIKSNNTYDCDYRVWLKGDQNSGEELPEFARNELLAMLNSDVGIDTETAICQVFVTLGYDVEREYVLDE
jgi:hypothetical protein